MTDNSSTSMGTDVAHIRLAEFFGAEAGQQRLNDECEIPFIPIGLTLRILIAAAWCSCAFAAISAGAAPADECIDQPITEG